TVVSAPTTGTPTAEATPTKAPPPLRRRGRTWPLVLASYLAMIFALITLNFLLPRFMPGDPITALVSRGSSTFLFGEESRQQLEEFYGLDGSLLSQYGDYLGRLVQGDMGRSIGTNQPVTHEVGKALPWTFLLLTSSILLSALIGSVLGVRAGWRRDKPADKFMVTGLLSLREFPQYLSGALLLYLVGVQLGWLPLGGAETSFTSYNFFERFVDVVRHAIMPVTVLTMGLTVGYYLVMRAGMVNELGSDYLLLGRAKGLRPRRLKYRYAARNAMLPVLSLTAVEVGVAVTASVLVERIFTYPGLGGLMLGALAARDYPVMQGAFLVFSVGVVTVNAVADVVYRRLDPRATI
ncbi:MAG: ABC transporter permease, partial [Acidimicrobiales bacterium]